MKYDVGSVGKVVVASLDDGDPVYESVATICKNESIQSAVFWIIGGVKNVDVVMGPKDHRVRPLTAVSKQLDGVQQILATGTVFGNSSNEPTVHIHASMGDANQTVTGCPRINLDCWLINELIIHEIVGVDAKRLKDSSGYELLTIGTAQ